MSDRPASWRMPTEKQMEKLAADATRRQATAPPAPSPTSAPADEMPQEYWDAVKRDLLRRDWIPIQNRRLSEIPRHILRVSCRRCDVGRRLLDDGSQERTGRHEEDGCRPAFE